jgi:phosphate transport system substrate-binding protein
MRLIRLSLVAALCAALAFVAVACGDDSSSGGGGSSSSDSSKISGEIAGAGASSQGAAQEAWAAGFQEKNPDATVSYDPVGSGGGREQFAAGGVVFAGSDAALAEDELKKSQDRCGGPDNLIEAPVYISPIAIIYNLEGVDKLQLSADTLAKIMKGEIKTWNDPAIKQDNPDASLPGDRITVVHRSDESGTTENFQDYLSKLAKDTWTYEVSGDWPVKGQEAAEGTSGVVDAVQNGKGTIGYADASQAGDLGKATIKVGDKFVEPSAEAAAKIFDESQETQDAGKYVFTYELKRDTTAEGTYPIVLASYIIACTKYDSADDAKVVKAFLQYIASEEGQQKAADTAGSAPIPDSVRQKIDPAFAAIGG